jgi:hypothetical protein
MQSIQRATAREPSAGHGGALALPFRCRNSFRDSAEQAAEGAIFRSGCNSILRGLSRVGSW